MPARHMHNAAGDGFSGYLCCGTYQILVLVWTGSPQVLDCDERPTVLRHKFGVGLAVHKGLLTSRALFLCCLLKVPKPCRVPKLVVA